MSEKVSSFAPIQIGQYDYVFLVVTWANYATDITTQLEKHFEPFGVDVGLKGVVVKAFEKASGDTAKEVLAKDWPEDLRKRLIEEQDPIMLIIKKDFKEFDPKQHSWSIIWFSDYRDHVDRIYKIFGQLARKTKARGRRIPIFTVCCWQWKIQQMNQLCRFQTQGFWGIYRRESNL